MALKSKIYSIGIDVGGTKMLAVLYDGEKVVADYTLGTPKDNLEHFMVMIIALIEPLVDRAKELKVKIQGIGLGLPGVIDFEEKKLLKAQNLPIIDGTKLAEMLSSRVDMPVEMDNDANCFLRSEMRAGVGYKHVNGFGVTIGTGIGSAWWFNNEVYQGSHGGAGELAHTIVDMDNKIDLETVYQKLTQNNQAVLATEAYQGDVLAEKMFEEIGNYFGVALANIVNLIDPEIIIVGGSVAVSGDLFLPTTKKTMREYIHSPEAKKIKIVKGKLGAQAGAIGAAMLIK